MQFTDDEGKHGGAGGGEPQRGAAGGEEALGGSLLDPDVMLEGLPDAVVAATRDGRIVFVNALAEELFGYSRAELIGRPVQVLWPEQVRERYTRNMQRSLATEPPLRCPVEAWGLRKDGSRFVGEMSWGVVRTPSASLLLAVGRDISARRAEAHRARAVAAIGERALAGAAPAALAAEAVEWLRQTLPLAGAEVRLGAEAVAATDGSIDAGCVTFELGSHDELRIQPERELTDEERSLLRSIASTLAITLARARDEERLRHEAVHDALTGLANRTLLRDRLEHALARTRRVGGAIGVLFIDLDNFKQVNDAHGHAAGDAVLVELSRRLSNAVRPADTVARFGGDEFVVVSEQVDEGSALGLARRLKQAVERELAIGETIHQLRASIGVALGETDADTLVSNADVALYRAKAEGGGEIRLFGAGRPGG
jgi:diguanylate cyclase (GGDEF)-like protein/PAS domain S-box-containing protein